MSIEPDKEEIVLNMKLAERSHSDFEAANESFSSTIRMLSLVNGGAALGMLGFLGRLVTADKICSISNPTNLVTATAISIGILCIGLLFAGVALIYRTKSKHCWAKANIKESGVLGDEANKKEKIKENTDAAQKYSKIANKCVVLGFVCFAAAIIAVLMAFFPVGTFSCRS